MESERILTKLQVEDIRFTDGGITDEVIVGSLLKYETAPTFTDPLHLVDKQYVDAAVGGGITPPATFSVLTSDTWPRVFDSAITPALLPFFAAIPTLVLREDTGGGVYRYRNIDICFFDSGASTLTINDVPFNGDITFKL